MISFAQAASQYVSHYRATHAPQSEGWRNVKTNLERFQKVTGITRLSEIAAAPVDQFILNPNVTVNACYWMRGFLEWCNKTYNLNLYVPPRRVNRLYRSLRVPRDLEAARKKIALFRATAEQCAPKMRMPHQKVIFLLGYLYGINLKRQVLLTLDDLLAVSPMRDDYYKALADTRFCDPMNGRALTKWLGKNHQSAGRVWREWVGGKDLPFKHVIWTGALDLADMKGRPRIGQGLQRLYWESLPRINEELVGRMRRWW